MDDDTKHHAKFLMLSHIIVVCNYRKNLVLHYGG
jgi:REP element-mobilizing transposase RayT